MMMVEKGLYMTGPWVPVVVEMKRQLGRDVVIRKRRKRVGGNFQVSSVSPHVPVMTACYHVMKS